LHQGNQPTRQLQQWLDRLAPVIEEARAALRRLKPDKLTTYSGCDQDADGNFRLAFSWQEYVISRDEFTIWRADTGEEPSSLIQSLVLTYLATADGTTPSNRWVSFRDLPSGMFYVRAFQGYTGDRLVRELRGGVEAFRRVSETLAGEPLGMGSAGYVFTMLPRVRLALVYWEGDEEFPSQAQVLFEDTAAHYLPADGLAILGSQLVGRLLQAAR